MTNIQNAIALNNPRSLRKNHPVFKYVAYFSIIDLLILPYFTLFVVPYSLPLVLIALITLGKIKVKKIYLYGIALASLFIALSVLTSVSIGKPQEFLIDDILRVFQLLTTFVYFFYFYTMAEVLSSKVIKLIMLLGLAYIVLFAIVFFINPLFFIELKQYLYPAGSYRIEDILMHMRFSYMFSDPNTAGYLFAMLVLFSLQYFKSGSMQTMLLLVSAFFIIVLVQSIGVVVSLAGAAAFVVLKSLLKLDIKLLTKILVSVLGLGLLFALIIVVFTDYVQDLSKFVDLYMGRVEANPEDSRLAIWQYAVTNYTPFLWGQGYTLFRGDGSLFRPHSDHFRLIYSYGLVAYFVFVLFFFRKIFQNGYLFLFPAFMAFSVNSLIDEQKLFGLFLVLLALAGFKSRQNRCMVNTKVLLGAT